MKRLVSLVLAISICGVSEAVVTRVQVKHSYPAAATTFTNPTAAGNLLAISISGSASGVPVCTVTQTGNTWVCLTAQRMQAGSVAFIDICYVLSCAANSNNISASCTNSGDTGWTAVEINDSGGGTWGLDGGLPSGSSFDGSTIAATTSWRTNAWSTTGTNDYIFMGAGDEANTQGTHTPTGSFSEIQWDNGHVDGQAEWITTSAQTSIQSGWDVATSVATWGLYVAAFTASSAAPAAKAMSKRDRYERYE